MFCPKCGTQLNGTPKFCNECGTKIIINDDSENRASVNAQVQCPSCGANLNAFDVSCPSCGREVRNSDSLNSVRRLEKMLLQIEEKRPPSKPVGFFETQHELINSTDKQKASCIEAFAIPTTKEDIVEFMLLAAANFDAVAIARNGSATDPGVYHVAKAWYAKFEQAYQKSKITLSKDPIFSNIENIYKDKINEIQIQKEKWKKTLVLVLSLCFGPFVLIFLALIIYYLLK